jgi:NitT/TauT family transport system substrate-binding protein
MLNRGFSLVLIVSIFVMTLILAACAPASAPVEPTNLKIAVLPIVDALPMFVAQEKGYFQENGVEVEFIPVGSAAERDQIMAAAQADGMINDLVSTLLYNQDATQIQIVSLARSATRVSTIPHPVFKDSGIKDANGLSGVEIGISEGSVIAYTTDRLLQAEGFSPEKSRLWLCHALICVCPCWTQGVESRQPS